MSNSAGYPSGSAAKPAPRVYSAEEKAQRAALREQEAQVRRQQNYSAESCRPSITGMTYYKNICTPPAASGLESANATGGAGKPDVINRETRSAGKPAAVPEVGNAIGIAEDLVTLVRRVSNNREVVCFVPPATVGFVRFIDHGTEIRESILHPLRAAITGEFPHWVLPETLNVGGVEMPLAILHKAIKIDWHSVLKSEPTVLKSMSVDSWHMQFYTDEPDPTPPLWPDRPRLDCVVRFVDGKFCRYHPKAKLIWSTEPMPTVAMQTRMRRKAYLLKRAQSAQDASAEAEHIPV